MGSDENPGREAPLARPTEAHEDSPKFGDLATFSKAGLRIVDDSLLARLNRPALSASTAKSMQGCTARWVGERVLQRPDVFAASSLGTSAHTVFERLFMRPPHSRTYRDALGLVLVLTEETFATPDPLALGLEPGQSEDAMRAIRADWANEVIDRVRGLWDIEDPGTVTVKDVEFRIEAGQVELGGVPFVGIIDRIDEIEVDGVRRLAPKDYKAGKGAVPDANKIKRYGDDHGDQLRLYYAALAELTSHAPARADVLYTFHGKAKKVAVAKSRVNATIRDFKQSWEILQSSVEQETFAVEPGPLCGWCPLVKACPAALATGKTARIAAPEPVELGLHIPVLSLAPESDGGVVHPSPDPSPPLTAVVTARTEASVAPVSPYESVGDPFDDIASTAPAHVRLAAVEGSAARGATPTGTDSSDSASRAPGPNNSITAQPAGQDSDLDSHLAVLTAPALPDSDLTNLEGDELMTAVLYAAREPKPWEGHGTSDGTLSGAAESAVAAFGTLELATTLLDERGLPLSKRQIMALSWTLLAVVGDAQRRLSGREDMDTKLHVRLRGALRTTISTMPPPLPTNAVAAWPSVAEWQEWVAGATRRVIAYAEMAHEVLTSPRPEQPYLALTEQTSQEAEVTPLHAVAPDHQPVVPAPESTVEPPMNVVISQPATEVVPAGAGQGSAYDPSDDFPL